MTRNRGLSQYAVFSVFMFFGLVLFSAGAVSGETPGTFPDDSVITAEINAVIAKDPDAHTFKVNATTIRGSVVLEGHLKSSEIEERLIGKISAIKGVKSVKSLMTVEDRKIEEGK
ncbi:MAG: BON domain-containing protein [Thermodesulfovibrionales bacterium]